MATLVSLVPVGLVLGLLAFGRYGGRHVEPTRKRVAWVAAATVVAGPLALSAFGFFGWLLLVIAAVAALAAAALLRGPGRPLRG